MPTLEEESEVKNQLALYEDLVDQMMKMVRQQIFNIHNDEKLTANNKTILKNFYLEHFVSPAAREAIDKYFPKSLRVAGVAPPSGETAEPNPSPIPE